MNEEIKAWLDSGKDYDTGCRLYEKYGSSVSLKRIHRMQGDTRSTMESIEYELRRLVKFMGDTPPVVASKPIQAEKPLHKPAVTVQPRRIDPLPPVAGTRPNTTEADELKSHVIGLLKVQSSLQATLEHMPQEQRAKDAAMICDLDEQISECYQRLSHYDKHGVLPPKQQAPEAPPKGPDLDQLDDKGLMIRKATLRSYVSRYKIKMKKASKEDKEKYKTFLDLYQVELDMVERKLKR